MEGFFDKVKQSIVKGTATVSVKSKEVIETTKVKNQINELNQQKKILIEELGNIVYSMFLKGTFIEERISNQCKIIDSVDDQMEEKEEELKQIHLVAEETLGRQNDIHFCSCGASLREGIKFCGKCGKKIESEKKKIIAAKEEKCANCGALLSTESVFCGDCGTKVEKMDVAIKEKNVCPHCDTEISSTAKFCKKCGSKV